MNSILKHIKKHLILYTTLISSILIICIVFKLQEVTPFGYNSLLQVDFFHQYGPMLGEYFDRIKNSSNLIYSFNAGMGIPIFRNFFNYLSSPFNIIMFLFKRKDLVTSFSFIIGLKAVASSLTCAYYLKKKFNIKSLYLLPLSILYAFCGYFTAFYWNIMWMDGMVLLPLITLGIENIVNKNKGILYTISLAIMLYCNYFIGYMLCIFSVLYFIGYFIIKTNKSNFKQNLKCIIKFALCSLISGLLMAWFLIPLFNALKSTSATGSTFPASQYYKFTFSEFIKNHLTGVGTSVFKSDISNCPNITCGILSVALFILFILNKKINLKRKIVYILLLLLIATSFFIPQIDYIWHAFHVPNDLPYRYSFLYSFILIIIGSYALKYIKHNSIKSVLITYALCIGLITFVYATDFENITDTMIKTNYLIITTYFLIYILYKKYPKFKKLCIAFMIIITVVESILTINHNWNITQYMPDFYDSYNDIEKSLNNIKKTDKDKFYRIEKTNILTFNDPSWYNYYGQTTFSSMAYEPLAKLNVDLGMPGNDINSYYYKQNTPIYDLMFDIKYVIGNMNDTTRYKYINEVDKRSASNLYKNNYTSGLMYGVNKGIKDWKYNSINPLEYQNDFIEYTTNIENTLHRTTLINKEIVVDSQNKKLVKFTYKNEGDNVYIFGDNSNIEYIIVDGMAYYKGKVTQGVIRLESNMDIKDFVKYDEEFVINTKTKEDTFDIYIKYNTYLNEEINVYTIDNDKFTKAYKYLNDNKINITEFNESTIKGNIKLDKNTSIYTSIPYDKGWEVFVNNKKIDTYKINDTLLGFDLKKGTNNIVLKYKINNSLEGISISITTLIFTICYLIIKKKKINHQ